MRGTVPIKMESIMKKMISIYILSALSALFLSACGSETQMTVAAGPEPLAANLSAQTVNAPYTADTPISDVVSDPVFGDYGRLIFPVDTGYYSGDTLGDLRLTWYSHIDPAKTVEIVNDMYAHAKADDRIFYDIQDLFYDHDGRTIAAGMGGHCQHGPGEDRCAGTFFQRCGSDDCLGRRRMFL